MLSIELNLLVSMSLLSFFHTRQINPLGSFFNGVFLLALALSILLQAIERFVNLQNVDSPKLILIVGAIGLGLNIISALVVHGNLRLYCLVLLVFHIPFRSPSWT